MILAVCVDDDFGMAFNRRRQTRDKKQREHMMKKAENSRIIIVPYSEKLFEKEIEEMPGKILVWENPEDLSVLSGFRADDLLFVEREDVSALLPYADKIYIYYWNRKYLSDVRFPKDELKNFRLLTSEHFSGSSHDDIIFEEYVNTHFSQGMQL